MNVASLELCRELYKLSGWKDCSHGYFRYEVGVLLRVEPHKPEPDGIYCVAPAYDLGYLLRKVKGMMVKTDPIGERGTAIYIHFANDNKIYEENANTPEDAACKLAIELLKQGVQKESGA